MARQARIVIPETPHHVAQRGNRGEPVFFDEDDYDTYLSILKEQCAARHIELLCHCLLPSEVHFIVRPNASVKFFGQAIGEAHRRYTRHINERQRWNGHLFQSRFFSCALDKRAALEAAHYIENLPVLEGMNDDASSYEHSSASSSNNDLKSAIPDWQEFISLAPDEDIIADIKTHLQTGRPRGSDEFIAEIEETLKKRVHALPVGRPKKAA